MPNRTLDPRLTASPKEPVDLRRQVTLLACETTKEEHEAAPCKPKLSKLGMLSAVSKMEFY